MITLFLALLTPSVQADEFWDEACLSAALDRCGKGALPVEGEFTEEQRALAVCRIRALAKCRKEGRK
jgi:hypothetical protein